VCIRWEARGAAGQLAVVVLSDRAFLHRLNEPWFIEFCKLPIAVSAMDLSLWPSCSIKVYSEEVLITSLVQRLERLSALTL
jgi:hypothetical protein